MATNFGTDNAPDVFTSHNGDDMTGRKSDFVTAQVLPDEKLGECSEEVVHKEFCIVASFSRFDFQSDLSGVVQLLAKDKPTRDCVLGLSTDSDRFAFLSGTESTCVCFFVSLNSS